MNALVGIASEDMAGEVGARVCVWLRQAWPKHTAKHAAQAFDCSPRTVEGWLAAQMPQNKHLLLMIAAWGPRFVAFVFEPAVGTSLQAFSINQEFQDLKAQMSRLEGALNAATEKDVRALAVSPGGPANEAGGEAR